MGDIFKEAIADAKAVRKSAVEVARRKLTEMFTPRIQGMLSQKITNEIEGDDEEENIDIDEIIVDEKKDEEPIEEPAAEETPVEEPVGDEFTGDLDDTSTEETPAECETPSEVPSEEGGEIAPESGEENDEINVELESIIKELEEDTVEEEEIVTEIADSSDIGTADNKKPSVASDDSSKIGTKKDEKVGDTAKETKDFLAEEEEESVDIDSLIAEIGKDDTETGYDEKINIDSILDELSTESVEENIDMTDDGFSKVKEELAEVKKENTQLKKSNEKYDNTISYLRKQLNEINLLNAKLLYTSSLFTKYSLNESQKQKVIDAFDRAKELRESKLIYTTLAEQFKAQTAKPVEQKRETKPITEAKDIRKLDRKTPGTKPGKDTKIIPDKSLNEMAIRFKQLAHLNENKK
jgi:hypothetical protein